MRLLEAPVIAAKLAARPELQNNSMIQLRTFVIERDDDFDIPFITYRHASQEERPPRGLQLPGKTRMDIHGPEESLSQEQIFKELVGNSFFIPSTRLHGSLESPPWVCNLKYRRVCSGFFPRKQFTKLSTWEDQQIGGKSHLLVQKSTRPSYVSFFHSSFHNPLRFSVQLA